MSEEQVQVLANSFGVTREQLLLAAEELFTDNYDPDRQGDEED